MTDSMSAEIGEIAAALAKAQSEMTFAHKDAENPFFKSNYADLNSILDAIREPLSKHDIAVVQTTGGDGTSITVITKLVHSSGQWFEGQLTMVPDKPGPQAFGSVLTYCRRYALAAIAGIAQADDDGESATEHKAKTNGKVWDYAENAAKSGTSGLESWFTGLERGEKQFIAANKEKWDKIKGTAADWDAKAEE